ncbi:PREDICTED: rho guanine nucleotide exchange factor 37 [Tauraco erythrolophus]|uniref:rho guanine nucleotide exchange factor 37 n=1 Tax=Tauraco erythrolophus TaxID=121530 RepID=UPI0005231EBD|nr:PREDICTED: rho guanine nucleotide exchange factor 37 [Tauraco erythrolophus]
MASAHGAEPDAEDEAKPEEAVYEEVIPCERMELSQRLAVEELITTEASYVHNIQLCVSDIRAHLQKKQLPDLDLEGLFSNTDDILHVSRRFLKGLEATATQEHEQLLCISTLFQEFKEEMETVYKIYCASYEHALLLVESYCKDPRLQEEILETLNATVPHTGASNLSFFLVMPVQRITKYPLLLGKILENTPTTSSAYLALQAAVRAMAQVNANINEYKRRREVATKYNKAEHLTLRDRLARLNTHSIAKKTTRLSRLLMHEAGIMAKTQDKEYDDLEEKFQCVVSSVTTLKENVASYLGHLEVFLLPTPHKRELQMDEGPAQQYRHFAEYLHCTIFPEFQRSKMGSITYDEEAAMNTYLAINALLVAELPRFNQAALQLLGQILCSLSTLQRDLAAQVLHQAEKELEQMPHGHMPLPSFWRMVEDTLQQSGTQLHTFCQTFETVTPSPVTQPLNPAEERKVLSLVSKHGPDKLYQVTSNISGSKDLDLTLQRGQIVALLQTVDTKGNTNRWLVDAGGPRGFVPAGKLQPYCPVQSQQPGMQMPALESDTERRRHSYASPEAPRPQVATFTPAFQVVAGFSFAARSPQEVSLQAGQPVVVLEPHDKKGNKEWSLVEVNGQRGYVPSSYLMTVPVQEPMGWSLPV